MHRDEERRSDLSLTTPVLTLADAFCDCIEAADEEAEEVRVMLLCAGEDLAQTVGGGAWDELDVANFLDRFALGSDERHSAAAIQLMGFYGWLEMLGLLEPACMKRQVRAIAAAAPRDPAILDYCAHLQSTTDQDRRLA